MLHPLWQAHHTVNSGSYVLASIRSSAAFGVYHAYTSCLCLCCVDYSLRANQDQCLSHVHHDADNAPMACLSMWCLTMAPLVDVGANWSILIQPNLTRQRQATARLYGANDMSVTRLNFLNMTGAILVFPLFIVQVCSTVC